jgi:transposase-like protein
MAKKTEPAKKERMICPNCGLAAADYSEGGYKLGSQTYCCQGCAEQTGCTCTSDREATA